MDGMSLINPLLNLRVILAYLTVIWRQRELTVEMTRREISERYAGQVLGLAWGFAHPLVMIAVYLFVFSFVFQARGDGGEASPVGDYSVYLLAGLVPWMAMAECLNKGSQVISSNANLVKQVIFPLEILPTKAVIATFVNELIILTCVVVYAGIMAREPNWLMAALPLLLAFQLMQMIGFTFVLSSLGAYVRDVKDVVQVFCLLNVYLMPVVYRPDWLPIWLRWMIYVNPLSYQTMCFQDALCYGTMQNAWVWVANAVISFFSLALGYRVFAKLRRTMGNVL
jgi:lipopolysaccharide transport system permease protein